MRGATVVHGTILLLVGMAAAQTVWLAGDSTMAVGGGGANIPNTQGWGVYLNQSLSIPVVNKAFAGRSARSFTREGRFNAIASSISAGDFVIMEFGHNDGGLAFNYSVDNGRQDCPPGPGPSGSEYAFDYSATCTTVFNNVTELVQTQVSYLLGAAELFHSLNATVIVSTMTPRDPYWGTANFTWSESLYPNYYEYARDVARLTEGKVTFINHGRYVADTWRELGKEAVDGFFPIDHTHTSPEGAQLVAKAFVKAVDEWSASSLRKFITV